MTKNGPDGPRLLLPDAEMIPAYMAFADQIRGRDWNKVLAPALFGEKGLADLQAMIEAHGIEALDLAVRDLLAKSKADRAIRRGHVRSWHFFRPYINEQQTKENAPCAE